MARQRCWLILAACALSSVVTSGSARAAEDDGICIKVTQYVSGEGKRAVDGTTLTYCASERDCHRRAVQVCCHGWTRDPNSKKLRCIKIDSSDSASLEAVDIDIDLDSGEDSTSSRRVRNAQKNEAGVQDSVRRPRGSPSTTEKTAAVADGSIKVSGGADAQSVPNPEKPPPNPSADLATKGDGKTETGAVQSKQTNSPVVAVEAGVDTSHSLTNGKQPVGPPASNTGETQSKPNSGSIATSGRDAPHASGGTDHPPSKSSAEGSGSTQKPLKNGPTSANGQSTGVSSQAEAPPHNPDVPVVVHPESKNNADSHSGIVQSEVGSQTPPKTDRSDQPGDAVQPGPVSGSATTAPPVASTVTPVPATNVKVTPNTPKVQPKGDQPTSTLGPASDNSVHLVTPASSEVAAANTSRGSGSPVGQGNNLTSPNSSVDCTPVHPDKNTSSTDQSSQGTGPLTLEGKEWVHGCREYTEPSPSAPQSSSAPPIVQTNAPTSSSTKAPVSTATSGSTPVAAATHPQLVIVTLSPKSGTSDTSEHPGPSAPLGTTITNTAASAQSISQGATTPISDAKAATAPAPQHPEVQAGGNLKYGDRCDNSSQCGVEHGMCDKQTGKHLCVCQPEYPATNHIDKCGKPAKINETCEFSEQCERTTEKTECRDGRCVCLFQMGALYKKDGSVECVDNTHEYNVTVEPDKGHGSTTQKPSDANSTAPTGQQGGTTTAKVPEKKGSDTSNGTSSTVRPQPSMAPPVAKPLDGKTHAATALPSGSSTSKTASEVTISLLLVAAVAFVAALLYWRARRRRRRYINCGTREPNLHFSNPVYDLEAMMEQTSLMKLQNAAEIEDGDDSDHEATFQRK